MAKTRVQEKRELLESLKEQGFDLSEGYGGRWGMNAIAVRCSQCEALVINGTATHERGCPNVPRHHDEVDE